MTLRQLHEVVSMWYQAQERREKDFDELKEKYDALAAEVVRLTKELDRRAARLPGKPGQPPQWGESVTSRKVNELVRRKLADIEKAISYADANRDRGHPDD